MYLLLLTLYPPQLKGLKWLDLKENPLEYPSPDVTGLCRNDAECKACATQVVQYMKKENTEQEKQKQKELEIKRGMRTGKAQVFYSFSSLSCLEIVLNHSVFPSEASAASAAVAKTVARYV